MSASQREARQMCDGKAGKSELQRCGLPHRSLAIAGEYGGGGRHSLPLHLHAPSFAAGRGGAQMAASQLAVRRARCSDGKPGKKRPQRMSPAYGGLEARLRVRHLTTSSFAAGCSAPESAKKLCSSCEEDVLGTIIII